MDIIICGAGQVGLGITEKLVLEGHNITVIDQKTELVESISDLYDVRGVVGYASYPDILDRAGASGADMIIAVTQSDEVNMMACQIGHSLFDIPTKLARIRSQNYLEQEWRHLFSRDNMPIDVIISPEIEVAEEIMRRLEILGALEYTNLVDNSVIAMAILCDDNCPIIDTPMNQLNTLFPDLSATVVGVTREGRTFVPHSNDMLFSSDIAYVICSLDHLPRTLSIFGHNEDGIQRIVIGGGGNVGRFLAKQLEERVSGLRLKLIEQNREIALKASEMLEHSFVIQGDVCTTEILEEANVPSADLYISLTNDDQVNLLSAVLASRAGAKRTMCLLNTRSYHELVDELGIDSYVNPRSVTISSLLKHIRRGRIKSAYSFQHGNAEVIHVEALPTAPIVGKVLRDIQKLHNIRFGAVVRKGEFIKPSGSLAIQAGDEVIVFYETERADDVEKLFTVGLDYIG